MNENQRLQVEHFRNAVIEECARVAENKDWASHYLALEIAKRIRALKEKP